MEGEIKNIISMLESGLECVHVRKPKMSTLQMTEYLQKIPVQFHKKLVLHSHHLLAKKFQVQGIHYTRNHLEPGFTNWLRNKKLSFVRRPLIKTASHNKLSSLYDETPIKFDYVFLSPIFDSITGKYQSGFYEDAIKTAIRKTGLNVIARGGIDATRIEKSRDLGFKGVALYSGIWKSTDPIESFFQIVKKFQELQIPID